MVTQATAKAASLSEREECETSGDPARRDSIRDAAASLFLKFGYGGVSMNAIAREAGVCKQTVYSHFGGKDALFGAIVHDKCCKFLKPLRATGDQPASDDSKGDPKTVLTGIGNNFFSLVLSDEGLNRFHVVVTESGRFPELAKAFYDAGPAAADKNLACYLEKKNAEGILKIEDPATAAGLFFGLLRGNVYLKRVLGLAPEPESAERDRLVAEAVRVFIAAYT
jgi:TetR/AcrR family transcriptional repressor of mexJK operon